MFRALAIVAAAAALLTACAAVTESSKYQSFSDRAPHFAPGAAVTGATVRGGG